MLTEKRNPRSKGLDKFSVEKILEIINTEDQRVSDAVKAAIPQIARAVKSFVNTYQQGGRIFYIGAGTSGRLGVLDAVECSPTFGISSDRIQVILAGGIEAFYTARESIEDDEFSGIEAIEAKKVETKDLVIGISASGETPFVIGGIKAARKKVSKTVGITNNPGSTLEQLCDIPIVALTGPEVLTGSTRLKAGTAQKMILNMLSTTAMIKLGKVYDNLMVDLQAKNEKLKKRGTWILKEITGKDEDIIKEVLKKVNYQVKLALVMLKGQVTHEEAEGLLSEEEGFVRKVLERLESNG